MVSRSTEPALGAIKLAWWRERLEELDEGKVPAEPRLEAAARELLPRGISGAELAELEPGWAALLQERPDQELALDCGAKLFGFAARLLGDDPPTTLLAVAGRVFAAGKLSRIGLAPNEALAIPLLARAPSSFRPLTALAALAARDLDRREPEATPARAWTLLRHRLTGKF